MAVQVDLWSFEPKIDLWSLCSSTRLTPPPSCACSSRSATRRCASSGSTTATRFRELASGGPKCRNSAIGITLTIGTVFSFAFVVVVAISLTIRVSTSVIYVIIVVFVFMFLLVKSQILQPHLADERVRRGDAAHQAPHRRRLGRVQVNWNFMFSYWKPCAKLSKWPVSSSTCITYET